MVGNRTSSRHAGNKRQVQIRTPPDRGHTPFEPDVMIWKTQQNKQSRSTWPGFKSFYQTVSSPLAAMRADGRGTSAGAPWMAATRRRDRKGKRKRKIPRAGEIGRERGSGRWRWRPATRGSPEEERSRVCGGGLAASASVVDPVQRW
jgi:hypothetical protein